MSRLGYRFWLFSLPCWPVFTWERVSVGSLPFCVCVLPPLSATVESMPVGDLWVFFLCCITSRDCAAQPEWFGGCHLALAYLPAGPCRTTIWRALGVRAGPAPVLPLSWCCCAGSVCGHGRVLRKVVALPASPASEQAPFPPAGSSGTLEGPGDCPPSGWDSPLSCSPESLLSVSD